MERKKNKEEKVEIIMGKNKNGQQGNKLHKMRGQYIRHVISI